MSYLFFFSRYQTKYVIKSLFGQFLTWKTLIFILNHPLREWLSRKNWGKLEIQQFEYLENEKRFLDKIKNILRIYLRAAKKIFTSGGKNKKERTQTLNAFLFAMSLCLHNLTVGLHLVVLYMWWDCIWWYYICGNLKHFLWPKSRSSL